MKKSSIILLLGCVLGASAQTNFPWFPIQPGCQSNYKIDSASSPITNIIKIDSASLSVPVRYYLNKIVTNCDTCVNASLVNAVTDTTYLLNSQPQFLKHSFSKISNTVFYFKGSRPIVLLPFSAIGVNWIFDTVQNIAASVVSRNVQNVLGIQDSVCSMKLSTNDTIILSKNFGIIQFPYKTIVSHKYKLAGIEGQLNAGIKLKRFHDFFDFAAGNVLQFEFQDSDFNTFPPLYVWGRERWDFLAVNIFPDSVCCKIRKTYYDSLKIGNSGPGITAYTSTVDITFADSLKHMANLFPQQEILVNPYMIYNNGTKTIHKIKIDLDNSRIVKSFGEGCPNVFLNPGNTGAAVKTNFTNVFLVKNSNKIIGRKLTEGLGFTSELFNDQNRIYERCLIGYIKGTDTSGTIYNGSPDGIKENQSKNTFAVYPVPASNSVFIKGKFEKETGLRIIDSFGRELKEQIIPAGNLLFNLNTAELENGMYFIVISNLNLTEIKKLVIQH